jgi:hypothetical protein
MSRRLAAYERAGVYAEGIPLRFNRSTNRYTDIGVDVRIGLDLVRWGVKGLYDVAIIVGEDSDLNEAAKDVYELRGHERWIALENALLGAPIHIQDGWPMSAVRVQLTRRCSTRLWTADSTESGKGTPRAQRRQPRITFPDYMTSRNSSASMSIGE